MTAKQRNKCEFVAVQKVWIQTSADGHSERRTRTLPVTPEMTIAEVMHWSKLGNVLAHGDVIITETDLPPGEP